MSIQAKIMEEVGTLVDTLLGDRLRALEERVAALESGVATPPPAKASYDKPSAKTTARAGAARGTGTARGTGKDTE